MTRTLLAHIIWMSQTHFLSPYEILIAEENKYLGKFSYHEVVCCMYSLDLPHQGNSN